MQKSFKEIVKKSKLIVYIYEMFFKIKNRIFYVIKLKTSKKYHEAKPRKVCWGGENPDKTFYVLRNDISDWGIYTIGVCFLHQLEWIEKKGYIPVVDLSSPNLISLDGERTNANKWDYYFEPMVNGYSLESIRKSKNVILGWNNNSIYWMMDSVIGLSDSSQVKPWVDRFGNNFNKYFRLNKDIWNAVKGFYDKAMKNKRIIGVSIRDEYRCRYLLHQKQIDKHNLMLTPEEYAQKTELLMKEWKCDYVYVMSDDEEALGVFKEIFGETLIFFPRQRIEFFKNGIPNREIVDRPEKFHSLHKNLVSNYLVETELLAMCTGLYSGISSSTQMALLRNNGKYEKIQLEYHGKYAVK